MPNCPICKLEVEEKGASGDIHQYRCKRCGNFQISGTAKAVLKHILDENDRHRALLSHAIRKMQRGKDWPLLTSEVCDQIMKQNTLLTSGTQTTSAGSVSYRRRERGVITVIVRRYRLSSAVKALGRSTMSRAIWGIRGSSGMSARTLPIRPLH